MQEKGTIFKKTFLCEIHSCRLGTVGVKYRAISSQKKSPHTPGSSMWGASYQRPHVGCFWMHDPVYKPLQSKIPVYSERKLDKTRKNIFNWHRMRRIMYAPCSITKTTGKYGYLVGSCILFENSFLWNLILFQGIVTFQCFKRHVSRIFHPTRPPLWVETSPSRCHPVISWWEF